MKNELVNLSKAELVERLKNTEKQLFVMRMTKKLNQAFDLKKYRSLRKLKARIMFYLSYAVRQ